MNKLIEVLISFVVIIPTTVLTAQGISAKYSISQEIDVTHGSSKTSTIVLDSEGYLFRFDAKNIYFQKPLYLDKYPDGIVAFTPKDGAYFQTMLVTDTIQRIVYNDVDSLIFRMSNENGHKLIKREFTRRKFEVGMHNWELLNEKKIIQGLSCQRAYFFADSLKKNMIWDVWFCADIKVNFGPSFIRDIPGLVVEAYCAPSREKFKLLSYSIEHSISVSVFWPNEFAGAVFKELPPFRNLTKANKKTKDQIKAEIISN